MGAIGGLLGLGGGAGGTGFSGPQSAPLMQGLQQSQVENAQVQSQAALDQQRALMQALQGAGGLQKQEGVYNELGGLSGNLQDIAAGRGPNPAQAMLNQQTGANIANQAALMAGQRGVGQNTGLLARQAAMQGGALQQQAVGQGATMQANQSLGALGQLAGVLGQRGGIANTQVANQMAGVNANTQANQAQQANMLNALGQYNQAQVAMQGNVNQANAGLAGTTMQGQQGLLGGLINAGGAAAGMPRAHGGVVGYAEGGSVGPSSSLGQFMSRVSAPEAVAPPAIAPVGANPGAQKLQQAMSGIKFGGSGQPQSNNVAMGSSGEAMTGALPGMEVAPAAMPLGSGGMVDVMLSPGEKVVSPSKVGQAAGGDVKASTVPGEARVAGDSLKNDTYKTKLPPGSIVIPRSHAKNEKTAAEFVRKTLARRGKK